MLVLYVDSDEKTMFGESAWKMLNSLILVLRTTNMTYAKLQMPQITNLGGDIFLIDM